MKLSRKAAVIMLTAALTLSLCVISVLPARGRPGMDAMTYNIDTLPARDLILTAGGPGGRARLHASGPDCLRRGFRSAGGRRVCRIFCAEGGCPPTRKPLPQHRLYPPPPRLFWLWALRRTASACGPAPIPAALF